MHVCCVIPPSPFLLDERVFPSLGILKVAASLEAQGISVEVLDLSGIALFEDAVAAHVQSAHVDWYAVTATTPQMPAAARILERIRQMRPDAQTVIGGPHPTLVCAAVKRESAPGRASRALAKLHAMADVIVAGDGEVAILRVLAGAGPLVDADDPSGPIFLTKKALEALPMPARHLIDLPSYRYEIDGVLATSLIAQLGCPFGCTFSVTGDTAIFTDEGMETIGGLARGLGEVRACAHGSPIVFYRHDKPVATPSGIGRITTALAEGVRPVFRVDVEGGLSIKGTAEHKLLVVVGDKTEWREIRHLSPGDFAVIKRPERVWPTKYVVLDKPKLPEIPPGGFARKSNQLPVVLDENLAWLTGFIVGDGCLPSDGRPAVHVCLFPNLEVKTRAIVKEQFGIEIAENAASNTDKMQHGWIHSRIVREFFGQVLDLDDKLKIPLQVWKSPRAVLAAFLEGLFDADAYVPKDGGPEYLATVSKRLAEQVAYALLMLGKGAPTIQEIRNSQRQLHYRVSILANDRIPTKLALYKSHKSGLWYWRTAGTRKFFKGVRRRTLRESKLHHPLDVDGQYYVEVKAVTPCPAEPVYDITVPGEHAFIANGFVSHNCGGRASPMLRRVRTRSTQNIITEMEYLYRTYGYRGYMTFDDELNVNRTFTELLTETRSLADRLGTEFRLRGFIKAELFTDEQAQAMYAAGFRWILTGFESGAPRILDAINKRATVEDNDRCVEIARRSGLKVKALMSLGHAGESEETCRQTEAWLLRTRPDDFDVTIITPYPGSPYYDESIAVQDFWQYTCPRTGGKLYSKEIDYSRVADYYKGIPGEYRSHVWTENMTCEDIVKVRDEIERNVRSALGIAYPSSAAAIAFDHSMGQSGG